MSSIRSIACTASFVRDKLHTRKALSYRTSSDRGVLELVSSVHTTSALSPIMRRRRGSPPRPQPHVRTRKVPTPPRALSKFIQMCSVLRSLLPSCARSWPLLEKTESGLSCSIDPNTCSGRALLIVYCPLASASGHLRIIRRRSR